MRFYVEGEDVGEIKHDMGQLNGGAWSDRSLWSPSRNMFQPDCSTNYLQCNTYIIYREEA